jgi:uncharacterized protein (TIGR03083 family)
MLTEAVDFRAEADELHGLLTTLDEADWQRATLFKSWTVNDILQHLHESDLMAAASVAGSDPFARMRAEIQALRDSSISRLQATRHRLGELLTWFGPDMGARMFATARQMETWAHGQAIYDLMGTERQPTDRLRNIAEIGVRTYRWTFANRGIPLPGSAPYVRLEGPNGAVWEWDGSSTSTVEGTALDFCQVVTQVRNVADTTLHVTGEPARSWMSLAQCFAGPPEDPPVPGARFKASPNRQHV